MPTNISHRLSCVFTDEDLRLIALIAVLMDVTKAEVVRQAVNEFVENHYDVLVGELTEKQKPGDSPADKQAD